MGQLLRIKDLCEYLGVDYKTFKRIRPFLPGQIVRGYWSKPQIDRWLAEYNWVDPDIRDQAEGLLYRAIRAKLGEE